MVVLYSTTIVLQLHIVFRLTSLPVDCCSTVFTDVMSLTSSPTLVTLLAKRTYILEDYFYLSLQCYETDTEGL